jgi:UDP-N-acetylglucosamine 4,6-dehydratase/5-epimerase
VLVSKDEARHAVEHREHYVIFPERFAQPRRKTNGGGKPLPEGFEYTSDANTQWISVPQLKQLVKSTEV